MTFTDASTDDGPDNGPAADDAANAVLQVDVDWGDNTTREYKARGAPFSHTYGKPGTYTLTHRAVDTKLQSTATTCTVTISSYYTISGFVKTNASQPLSSAAVLLTNTATAKPVTTVYTALDGSFTVSSLKPGTYRLAVRKTGYVFPLTNKTVGPNQVGFTVNANP